jgi:hypothetical protein
LVRFPTRWVLRIISTAPSIDAPENVVGSASDESGESGPTLEYKYVVTAVKAETYEESLPSDPVSVVGIGEPTPEEPHVISWDAVTGAVEYNVYCDLADNGTYGFIGVATGQTTFNNIGYPPDLSLTPPIERTLFDTADNYPATATTYQQRRVFASTNNDKSTAWTSRTGFLKNFSIRSPLQEDDAVTFTVVGRRISEIRHAIEAGKLVLLTASGECVVFGNVDGVLTPFAINAKHQSYYGTDYVMPVVVGNTIIFVQVRGRALRDLEFSDTVDGYRGRDLQLYASHLTETHVIERIDFAQVPHSVIWAVRSDGTLLGCTYIKDLDAFGWHRHDTADGTGSLFQSLGAASSPTESGRGVFEDVRVIPEGKPELPSTPPLEDSSGGSSGGSSSAESSSGIADEFGVDAIYVQCNPRIGAGELTNSMFMLGRDKLYRSTLPSGGDTEDWTVWEEIALPANGDHWKRIWGDPTGIPMILADNRKIATKEVCNLIADPLPQTDNPFVAYDTIMQVNPYGGYGRSRPTGAYSAIDGSYLCTTLMSTEDSKMYAVTDSPAPASTRPSCVTQEFIEDSEDLPGGYTWNRVRCAEIITETELTSNVLALSNGNKVARWFSDTPHSDTGFVLVNCPDGDWRDVAFDSDAYLAVGVGENQIMVSTDGVSTFAAITAPDGAVAVNPRVRFDPGMSVSGTIGTFVSTGWEIDGVEGIILIPLNSGGTFGTPRVAVIPELSPTVILRGVLPLYAVATPGCIVIGIDTADDTKIILSNDEGVTAGTEATYDNWVLKTIAEAPF